MVGAACGASGPGASPSPAAAPWWNLRPAAWNHPPPAHPPLALILPLQSCPEGTKCRGSRHGETPCKYRKPKGHTQKHPVPDKAKCDCDCSHDDCKDCDHCQDDHRRSCDDCRDSCDHPDCKYCKRCREERCDCDCGDDDCHCRTCGKSQPSCDDCDCDDDECQHCDKCDWGEECPGGKDNVCTSSNSYCHVSAASVGAGAESLVVAWCVPRLDTRAEKLPER